MRAISARLKAADVHFDRELHDGIYGLTIYVYDPDGNMIELYEEGAEDAVRGAHAPITARDAMAMPDGNRRLCS